MKIPKLSKKIKIAIILVVFCIIIAVVLIGIYHILKRQMVNEIYNSQVEATKQAVFDDFASIQQDFERVRQKYAINEVELLSTSDPNMYISIDDNDSLYVYSLFFEFDISTDEEKSFLNVYNSFSDRCSAAPITKVYKRGDEYLFVSDDWYYAMVYCASDDLKPTDVEYEMGQDAGIVKLSDCWYQVIRHPN